MKYMKRISLSLLLCIALAVPKPAKADLFGGDVAVLVQILANAVQQLIQLKEIVGNGQDTLSLLQEINRGIRDGLAVLQMVNPKFNPGIYGSMDTAQKVLDTINDLYGAIPQSAEAKLQQAQDQSASESIAMNGTLFRFADEADSESKRIFAHSRDVSPQGAAKLTAQSLAVLIGVTTQVLRTNSMILKNMGENAALQNRKEKLQSAQFRTQYDQLSVGIEALPKEPQLVNLQGN